MRAFDGNHSIPAFYAGRSILVTGATGFMGKVLLEKLLRSCPDLQEIFLLMRPKRGMTIDDRLRQMLSLPLFDTLRASRPSAFDKLIPVTGDTSSEGLGLPPMERKIIIEKVSVIFHVAASVRFDDPLRHAVFMNTRSARDICILAGQMKKLVSLMHVSTTYCHTERPVVEEKVYPVDVDWKKTIKIAETVDDHTLRILTAKFLGNSPNTYTFTKRLAEQVISDYAGLIPAVIFRPSIVISSLKDPIPGWLDNFNGPVGMMAGGGKGVLRVVNIDPQTKGDFIPVDVAIKAMIIAAWKRGKITITRDPSIHVYNCASNDIKNLSMKEVIDMGLQITEQIPLEGIIWIPDTIVTRDRHLYLVLTLLLHVLPALIIDGILLLSGNKTQLMKLQKRVYIAITAVEYFMSHGWKFNNQKLMGLLSEILPNEEEDFGFQYGSFDTHEYFKNCIIGAKLYLLKEDMNRLDAARAHYKRMWWIDKIAKVLLAIFAMWLSVKIGVVALSIGIFNSFVSLFKI